MTTKQQFTSEQKQFGFSGPQITFEVYMPWMNTRTTVSVSYWPDLSVHSSRPCINGGIEHLAGSKLVSDILLYRRHLGSREKLVKGYDGQLEGFISSIPRDVLDYIVLFGCHHWDLLTAASSGKGFFDLMKSNSFLALLLASVYRFRKYTSRKEQIRNICKMKQREIITLFSLRDQEWIAGVLKKVPVHSVYTPVLSDLLHVLRTDHWKKELCHLENLPLSIFSLMNAEKFAPFLNFQLLNEFVYEGENMVVDELSGFVDALSKVEELNKVLQTDFITIPNFSLLCLRRIRKIRHEWLMLPTPSDFEQPLPEAPFQGTDRIRPITGVTELYCEGLVWTIASLASSQISREEDSSFTKSFMKHQVNPWHTSQFGCGTTINGK